jgi:hypothetical protein
VAYSSLLFVKLHGMLSRMFRDTLSSSSAVGREEKWETGSVFQGRSAAVNSSLCGGDQDPSLNDRRVLDRGFELPDQSVAVIDVKASFDCEHLANSSARARPILHLVSPISSLPWQSTFSTQAFWIAVCPIW